MTIATTAALHDHGHGIWLLDAGMYRDEMVAIHLIVHEGRVAVIDTATRHSLPRILGALEQLGLSPQALDWVILTHIHLDHAGGAGALMQQCPNARLAVHPRGARHMANPRKLWDSTVSVYGLETAQRVYGEVVPIASDRIEETPEGHVLHLGSRRLQVLDTPGHARHHIAVHDPFSQSVFAGDTFGISYREFDRGERQFVFPTTSPVQFDPQAAHHSVDRILACQPQSVYVTHYSRLTDLVNIAASMHRLIDAHAELALAVQSTGAAREAELVAGVKRLFLAETARFGCTLGEEQALALMGLDIQLNGQGLASWLDSR